MENIKNQISEIMNGDVGIFSLKTQMIVENSWVRLGRFCHEKYGIGDIFCVSAAMLDDYLAERYKSALSTLYLQTEASKIAKLLKVFQRSGIDTQNHEMVLQKFKAQLKS